MSRSSTMGRMTITNPSSHHRRPTIHNPSVGTARTARQSGGTEGSKRTHFARARESGEAVWSTQSARDLACEVHTLRRRLLVFEAANKTDFPEMVVEEDSVAIGSRELTLVGGSTLGPVSNNDYDSASDDGYIDVDGMDNIKRGDSQRSDSDDIDGLEP